MRRPGIVVALAALAALAVTASACAEPDNRRLRSVDTWAFAIGTGSRADVLQRPGAFDLVVVDGEEVTGRQVRKLKRHGTIVLGYLSVGTIENWRWWHDAASRYELGEVDGWAGERYADVSRKGYRDLIASRVAPRMLSKGLNGLFLDNTDMVETHRGQRDGMKALVRRLARKVHRRNKFLFSQNGASVIGSTLKYYDGWNREDVTWTYDGHYVRVGDRDHRDALAEIRRMRRHGLLVTTTDYVAAGHSAALSEAVDEACKVHALPYVSDIELTRVPSPLHC